MMRVIHLTKLQTNLELSFALWQKSLAIHYFSDALKRGRRIGRINVKLSFQERKFQRITYQWLCFFLKLKLLEESTELSDRFCCLEPNLIGILK